MINVRDSYIILTSILKKEVFLQQCALENELLPITFFLYVETETAYILTSFPMIVLVLMLELCIYTGNREKVRWKALTEEHARDSFENLLFSVCRFRELTGSYPQNITVCSFLILFDLMEDLMGT